MLRCPALLPTPHRSVCSLKGACWPTPRSGPSQAAPMSQPAAQVGRQQRACRQAAACRTLHACPPRQSRHAAPPDRVMVSARRRVLGIWGFHRHHPDPCKPDEGWLGGGLVGELAALPASFAAPQLVGADACPPHCTRLWVEQGQACCTPRLPAARDGALPCWWARASAPRPQQTAVRRVAHAAVAAAVAAAPEQLLPLPQASCPALTRSSAARKCACRAGTRACRSLAPQSTTR